MWFVSRGKENNSLDPCTFSAEYIDEKWSTDSGVSRIDSLVGPQETAREARCENIQLIIRCGCGQ